MLCTLVLHNLNIIDDSCGKKLIINFDKTYELNEN